MRHLLGLLLAVLAGTGCDRGLTPPPEPPAGHLRGVITYTGTWPPADSLLDLRFVAMRFVPQDTLDFFRLDLIAVSDTLDRFVAADTFFMSPIEAGVYVYSGVAQHYATDLFAWRPLGLYEETDGIFEVRPGETTELVLHVDFGRRPIFPPPKAP